MHAHFGEQEQWIGGPYKGCKPDYFFSKSSFWVFEHGTIEALHFGRRIRVDRGGRGMNDILDVRNHLGLNSRS